MRCVGAPPDIADLSALELGIRVDREGQMEIDFKTIRQIISSNLSKKHNAISHTHYLSDAVFLVGLHGPKALLEQIQIALKKPRWPIPMSFTQPICR